MTEERIKCFKCTAFDTDVDVDEKHIDWCDKLERNIKLEADGHCLECPDAHT